jgi:hypothetical protein
MQLTDQELAEVAAHAGLLFSPEDIAIIMGVDIEEFKRDFKLDGSPIRMAYLAAKLKAEAEIRKSIFNLAKAGSSPAQTLLLKLVENANIDAAKAA